MEQEMEYRREEDSLGTVRIPRDAGWGPQTQRAVDNFSVSSRRIPRPFLRDMALIKAAYARAAGKRGLYPREMARAVQEEAEQLAWELTRDTEAEPGTAGVSEGQGMADFPVDVFQTGSGTSWNMNLNEVLARRAGERLRSKAGVSSAAGLIHPNDHVNCGQSSNDVIPSALQMACRREVPRLIGETEKTAELFFEKAKLWRGVLKLGRTHLQDAVPLSLGDEMEAYGEQLRRGAERLRGGLSRLEELALGGTAVGTGLNCPPGLAEEAAGILAGDLGIPFRRAASPFEALSCRDDQVELAGYLNGLAVSWMKIANDFRLLSSGPRGGFGELALPSLQPGSSIMPGKVNPVLPEMMIQAAARVMGMHTAVSVAGQNGPLEINIMQPLIASEILEALDLLTRSTRRFREGCLAGAAPRDEVCRGSIEKSLALITPLALEIGYEKAAKLAQKAWAAHKTVRQTVLEEGILSEERLEAVLNPERMARGNRPE